MRGRDFSLQLLLGLANGVIFWVRLPAGLVNTFLHGMSHYLNLGAELHYQARVTEPNRLMLCGETVAVCCENRTEHTYTVGNLPHRKHITSPLQSPTG
jgi:hypothetical protein